MNEELKKLNEDFKAYVAKLEAQKGSNVTVFQPEDKAALDALVKRLSDIAS